MRISSRFNMVSILHEGVHYFPQDFDYTKTGVHVVIYHKRHKWIRDSKKITLALADEIMSYYNKSIKVKNNV